MTNSFKQRCLISTAIVTLANLIWVDQAGAADYGQRITSTSPTTVNVGSGQTVEGDITGIYDDAGSLTLNNAGTIKGHGTLDTLSAPPGAAVVIGLEGSSVTNSGTIYGDGAGINTEYHYNPQTGHFEGRAIGTIVTNSGTITGQANDGVRLIGGGTVDNAGTIEGLTANASSTTDGVSMYAFNDQSLAVDSIIGTVKNRAGGTIAGQRFGIILSGGGVVENVGTINGDVGGVLIQSQTDTSGGRANVYNGTGGTISGGDGLTYGADIRSSSLDNHGTITGTSGSGVVNGSTGILAIINRDDGKIVGATAGITASDGALNLDNMGTIHGNGTLDSLDSPPGAAVVIARAGSSVVNSGVIDGAGAGISTEYYRSSANGPLQGLAIGTKVTNSGTITGEANDGVRLIGGGTVTNSGTIKGVNANASSSTDGVSMFAFDGQSLAVDSVIGTLNNQAGGTVSGQRFGAILSGGGDIENAGTITGGVGGVLIQSQTDTSGGKAIVNNTGTITGSDGVTFGSDIRTASLDNSGTINGTGTYGVHAASTGTATITNSANGTIDGQRIGIFGDGSPINVTNAGLIKSETEGSDANAWSDAAITTTSNQSVITNSGTITGARYGIVTGHVIYDSTTKTASVDGNASGATIVNTGHISGRDGAGIYSVGGDTITNSGIIDGQVGILVSDLGQTVSGTLNLTSINNETSGRIYHGLYIETGGGTVVNAGTIYFGASINAAGSEAVSFTNTGNVNGSVTLTSQAGSYLSNAGFIDGEVNLSEADDAVVLHTGSAISRGLFGLGGDDTITLDGTGMVASYAQLLQQVSGFEHLIVANGYWQTAKSYIESFGQASIAAGATFQINEVGQSFGASAITSTAFTDNGTLVLNYQTSRTIASTGLTTSGSGGVRLEGTGTLTVADGSLAHTGMTEVANGTLVLTGGGSLKGDVTTSGSGVFQLGDGGTTGDFTGNLVNNGTFVFNRSDDYSFTGAISGTGTLTKMGAGTLTFVGDYSFAGTTVIDGGAVVISGALSSNATVGLSAGTFDVGSGSQTIAKLSGDGGAGVVAINGGSLTLNQTESSSFDGNITGTGTLVKSGDGRLNLTGTNDFSGATQITGGILSVNGSLTNSTIAVSDGGTIGGNGTVGSVTAGAGGIIGPGNSPGTLHVAGGVTFGSGSIYSLDVTPDGTHDEIIATGAVTIAPDARVVIHPVAGDYARKSTMTILTAAQGVSGQFGGVTSDMAFLTPVLGYDANDITLSLYRNDVSFASLAATPNQARVAAAIEKQGIGAPLYEALVVQDAAGARAGYDALSGQLYASVSAALTSDSRYVRDALLGGAMPVSGLHAWVQPVGDWLKADARGDAAAVSTRTIGVVAGLDKAWNGFSAGFAAGAADGDHTVGALASSATSKSTFLGLRFGYRHDQMQARVGGAFGWHSVSADRRVDAAGISDTLKGSYHARTTQLFGELSYDLAAGGLKVTPFSRVGYVHTSTDGFMEQGGMAALNVARGSSSTGVFQLGARFSAGQAPTSTHYVRPRLSVAWQRLWGDVRGSAFASFDGTTDTFRVAGMRMAPNAGVIDAGLDIGMGRATVSVAYIGELAGGWSSNGVKMTLSLPF